MNTQHSSNLEAARQQLEGDVGYQFDLDAPFEQAKQIGGLASSAHAFVNTGVKCQIVGLDEQGRLLYEKARSWLLKAISENERPIKYFPHATEAMRYFDLYQLNWLLEGKQDKELVQQGCNHLDLYLSTQKKIDKIEVSLQSPHYLEAGRCERLFELLSKIPSFKVPEASKIPTNEFLMSLILCEHESVEKVDQARLDRFDKFLVKKMDEWLSRGHFDRVAMWIRIRFSDKSIADIGNTLRKCLYYIK